MKGGLKWQRQYLFHFETYKRPYRYHKRNRYNELSCLLPAFYGTCNISLGVYPVTFFLTQEMRKIKLNAQLAPPNSLWPSAA